MGKYLALLLLLCSPLANANDNNEGKLMTLVHSRLGLFALSASAGVLGPNGERYVASVAAKAKDDTSVRLVLFRESNATPTPVLQSQEWDNVNQWSWLVAFKKGSLFLYGDPGSCGAVCHSSVGYQFKIRDGEYRLIGVNQSNVRADPPELITTSTSINLLTKKVRYSRESCHQVDDNPWFCASKTKVSVKEFSFLSDQKWALQEFSPDIFDEFQEKTKYLHGHIDANLTFGESNP